MNILLIGSGAREHAIARALKRSPQNPNLFCFASSNNPGIKKLATGYEVGKLTDAKAILSFAKANFVDLAVIGPEAPLEAWVVDVLEDKRIPCVGPRKELAQLETSKGFTRQLMADFNIPGCPKFKYFPNTSGVQEFLEELGDNYVIKADGLMGGKGVKVAGAHLQNHAEAIEWCQEIVEKGQGFVIEEKFVGQEFSLMSFCDGEHLAHMPAVQDHKRAYEGDKGPNTGGMGSYSAKDHSLPFLSEADIEEAKKINEATRKALKEKYGNYRGILYGGFILTKDGVKLIEYNARFGDPEAMNVLSILESDFVEICTAITTGSLTQEHAKFKRQATVCKYAVPEGYPDNPVKDQKIDVSQVQNKDLLFYAAVDEREDGLYETGSRAVAVVGIGNTIAEAEKIAEAEINRITGPLFHRSDIGKLSSSRVEPEGRNRGIPIQQQKLKLAILGSTNGTDMEAIVEAIKAGELNASIELVVSNKEDAGILDKAKNYNLDHVFVDQKNKTRESFDKEVMQVLESKQVDLILLIGYMRILSPAFVEAYRGKIMNVHPSLLPAFAGGMDLDVHQAILDAGVKITGCTIHYVDEGVDSGEIIVQKSCSVDDDETNDSLKAKVQKLEGEAFIEAIKKFKFKKTNQIKRALISVSDKTGIVDFARELSAKGVEIISTGGTAKALQDAGIKVKEISEFTGFPEIMEGRVKTLHPLVHGGILGKRDKHEQEAEQNNIEWIDLVVCNLYPFSETIAKTDVTEAEAIENIDIGGPSMIRSAAKNSDWVGVVVDPDDYELVLSELKKSGSLAQETRKKLSAKAFSHTAGYDAIIAGYFDEEKFPDKLNLSFNKAYAPRYGENPHQEAAVYKLPNDKGNNILNAKIHQGKKLSYNNIGDADAALAMTKEFYEPACVVVKHANPCGISTADNIFNAFKRAYAADSLSAFGGIISLNRPCSLEIAEEITKVFAEIVIAPGFEPGALEILAKKKNMRVLEVGEIKAREETQEFKYVDGGLLVQDVDVKTITKADLTFPTEIKPTDKQLEDMLFAWKVLKHVKSNGILIAKDLTTVGLGCGQVSRVDAVDIAIKKSGGNTSNAVLASDAFFPFRDSIDKAAAAGIQAVIQPGGSINDKEVITACDELGIAMAFTGARCFKH